MSDVPGDAGPFTVYIVGQDLHHTGSICYDDNRDGTPERCVPSDGIAAFQVKVDYDPKILAVGIVQSGPELSRSGRSFQCLPADAKPGSIAFGCLSQGDTAAGVTGTLTLASLEFIPRADGLSPLALDAELAGPLGDSVTVSVGGGAARVSGIVTAPPTAETGASPAPGASSTPPEMGPTLPPGASPETATTTTTTTTPAPAHTAQPTSTSIDTSDGSGGGSSFGSATLWSIIIGGTIGAGGLLTLGAMVWRQRQHRSHV
jgi:hypothetical protein